MEDILQSVIDILACDESLACAVVNKLTEMGVSSVSDLVEVQITDLTPQPLLPIPARKLVRQWSMSINGAAVVAQPVVTAAVTPSSGDRPSTSTALQSSTAENTPLASDIYSSRWAENFDLQQCVNDMCNSSEISERKVGRNLRAGKFLQHFELNELIRFIANSIRMVCSNPARKSFNCIAQGLVDLYPQLRDEVAGTVIGPGYLSVRNQLENRLSYLKRPESSGRRSASARRRIDVSDAGEADDVQLPRKRLRDGYGCVDFLPVALPGGENDDTLRAKVEQLKTMHRSCSTNYVEITDLMSATYILQRQDIVGTRPVPVTEIREEWPFLCQPKWMVDHLQRLLGVNVLEKLEASILSKRDILVQYFRSVTPTMKEVSNKLKAFDVTTHPVIGLITVVMAYFGESETTLLKGFEVMFNS
jgi:hypothetical protein